MAIAQSIKQGAARYAASALIAAGLIAAVQPQWQQTLPMLSH